MHTCIYALFPLRHRSSLSAIKQMQHSVHSSLSGGDNRQTDTKLDERGKHRGALIAMMTMVMFGCHSSR